MSAAAPAIDEVAGAPERSSPRGWLIFAVSFGLLLSDYMSRQVLSAVFPQLKLAWSLTDGQLGALGGAVPLAVGILTFPLSVLADRFGRARSVAVMALTWSLATAACGFAAHYNHLLLARLVLGVGEAAYGSVGLAVVFTYFPRSLRATITSAFMAGGLFGSFFGLTGGGLIAERFGWRAAFLAMAGLGLLLTLAYLAVAPEARRWGKSKDQPEGSRPAFDARAVLAGVLGSRRVVFTYIASGLQLFVMGALTAWTPSLINRTYGLEPGRAAVLAALLMLSCGVGMIVCGRVSDTVAKRRPEWTPRFGILFALCSFVLLQAALALPPGPLQMFCALAGFLVAAGTTGPAGALVSEATPARFYGAALAILTLANNLIGLAPGSAVTGAIADRLGLLAGLRFAVCASLPAALFFWLSARAPTSRSGPTNAPGGI